MSSQDTQNHLERRERAEHLADVLAVVGLVVCLAVGGGIGMALFGTPGMVVGAVALGPLSMLIGGVVNRMPFMKDVY